MSRILGILNTKRSIRTSTWLSRHWRDVVLPLGLIGLVLVFLNWGLYRSLNPEKPFTAYTLPYSESFNDATNIDRWFIQGGEWVIRDEALMQAADGVELGQIFIPQWLEEAQVYRLTIQIEMSDSTQAAGISFNAQYPQIYSLQHRVLVTRNGDRFEVVAGYMDALEGFIPQVKVPLSSNAQRSQSLQTFRLDLLVDENVYHVRVDGQTVIYKRPLFYHGGLVGIVAVDGPSTFDNITLVAVEKVSVDPISTPAVDSDDEARAVAEHTPEAPELPMAASPSTISDSRGSYSSLGVNGQTAFDGSWIPFSGDWQVEAGSIIQLNPNGYDLGIGYEDGAFQSFVLEVSLAHLQGRGGGVLFNMPTPYQLNGAHMVRYSDRADAIFWGYYDDDLTFIGQGYAKLSAPRQTSHTFRVVSTETMYNIYLDDQLVVRDVPLHRNSGYIGLITSQSSVVYDWVEVSALADVEREMVSTTGVDPNPSVVQAVSSVPGQVWTPTLPDSNTTWTSDAAAISQNSTTATDYILSTDVFAKEYTLETSITLPDKSDSPNVGAGIIFHMPEQNRKNQAHMARLIDGGSGVFWGYYNEAGKFIGQGRAALSDTATTYTFKIVVQQDTYKLVINGETIASDIQLTRREGWIGLLTYSGPVMFHNVGITLGESE